MGRLDPLFVIILSDLFVNLSAGWFGAAFIVTLVSKRSKLKFRVLFLNLLFGTISLVVAYVLRRP